jgi:N-acetyl-gamma-glutamyl-phosphate reductase
VLPGALTIKAHDDHPRPEVQSGVFLFIGEAIRRLEMAGRIKAGVFGAAGYAGGELVRLLLGHPCVELTFATSNSQSGQQVPGSPLHYVTAEEADLGTVEVVFLALPHGAAAAVAAAARSSGVRVVDLSADFRLETAEVYQRWYGKPHPHPEMLPVPYGLPEINRNVLRGVDLIAAPGCYPTTTLLGLYPLLRAGALEPGVPVIVDAKSGVSGAGREPKQHTHFVEVFGNLSPYSPGRSHRHVGEIEQAMHKIDPAAGMLIFTPHLLPVDRGLMASIYVTLQAGVGAETVQSLYETTYSAEPLVDVLPPGQQATLRHAVRQNNCAISLTPVGQRYVHITSVTDNLLKGAASQAVQGFNLMFDLPETMGLL